MSSDTTRGQSSWFRPLDNTTTSTCAVHTSCHMKLDSCYTKTTPNHAFSMCLTSNELEIPNHSHTPLAHLRDDNRQMLHGISRHFSQPQLVSESLAGNSLYTSLQHTQQLGLPWWGRLQRCRNSRNAFNSIESPRNK